MKEGQIEAGTQVPTESELEQINKLTRRNMSADEVYTFSVVLCDNEIDRDFERFSIDALHTLAALYVGKSGIFDHSMQGKDQIARIFSCEVESFPERRTKSGEVYHRLKARAYMPKTSRNEDFILEIDAGIKKEVSVGCSVGSATCSVCGADLRKENCGHKKGRFYRVGGKKQLCHAILSDPKDAYEWSFVAVPAQPQAGVVKGFRMQNVDAESEADLKELFKSVGAGDTLTLTFEQVCEIERGIEKLQKQAEIAENYRESLKEQASRLFTLLNPNFEEDTATKIFSVLSASELEATVKALKKSLDNSEDCAPQISFAQKKQNTNETYKI